MKSRRLTHGSFSTFDYYREREGGGRKRRGVVSGISYTQTWEGGEKASVCYKVPKFARSSFW
jgi:hypothetical protein